MPSASTLVLKYPKRAIEIEDIYLSERTAGAVNPPTSANYFHVQVDAQGEILILVAITVLLTILPASKTSQQDTEINTISLNETYNKTVCL